MSDKKFPIGQAVPCKFKGFRHKKGDTWEYIQVSFVTDNEEWLNATFWKPDKTSFTTKTGKLINLGTIEEQESKVFNKLAHTLEAFGLKREDLSSSGSFEDFYNDLRAQGKQFLNKAVYVKTVPGKEGDAELGYWYPFVSQNMPDLNYSPAERNRFGAVEKVQVVDQTVDAVPQDTETKEFNDLPF